MKFQKNITLALLGHFITDATVAVEDYSIEKNAVTLGDLDVINVTITDKVTDETNTFDMYALEIAHLMVGDAKDWLWLKSGWQPTAPEQIMKTISKVLLAQNIDYKAELKTAKLVYLGKNTLGQPIVQITATEPSWFQMVHVVHLPVVIETRIVQDLLEVSYEPIDATTLGQETVA